MDKIKEFLLSIGFVHLSSSNTKKDFYTYNNANNEFRHHIEINNIDDMYRFLFMFNITMEGIGRHYRINIKDSSAEKDLISIKENIPEFKHLYRKKKISKLLTT